MSICDRCNNRNICKLRHVSDEIGCNSFSGWISVKDRLPEEYVAVLIWDGDNVCKAEYVTDYGWGGIPTNMGLDRSSVTHWMPLPEPPKEEV